MSAITRTMAFRLVVALTLCFTLCAVITPAQTKQRIKPPSETPTESKSETTTINKNKADKRPSSPSLADTLRRLASESRINILFDLKVQGQVDNQRVEAVQHNTPALQAIENLLDANQLSYVPMDRHTILVFQRAGNYTPYISLAELVKRAELYDSKKTIGPNPAAFRLRDYTFRDAPISIIIQTIADAERLNIVYDDAIAKLMETKKINFILKGVTSPRALKILLDAQRLEYLQVDYRTIMIMPKSPVLSPTLEEILQRANEDELSLANLSYASRDQITNVAPEPRSTRISPSNEKRILSGSEQTSPTGEPVTLLVRVLNPQIRIGQTGLLGIILNSPSSQTIKSALVTLRYNPKVLKLTAVKDGGLMSLSGAQADFQQQDFNGVIQVNINRPANSAPVPASGQLALIYYLAVGEGTADLTINQAQLKDADGNAKPVTIVNGEIEVLASATSDSDDDKE